jgi:hypothetical protein
VVFLRALEREIAVVWWMWLALLVGVALLGSIAVAVQRPGRARDLTAWLGAVGFYVVLVAMFGDWARAALASGAKGPLIGLGFLFAMFSIGLVVALFKTASALRRRGSGDASATH